MSRGSLRRVYDDNSALLTEMKSTERYKRAVERMQKESHGSARPRCSRRWRSGRSASAQLRKPLKHHRDISNLGHLHAPRRERRGDRYGFRIIARKTGAQVMLYSRPGNDLKDSLYRSGRSRDWLKMKNPAAPAVKREEGEDWSR